MRLVVARFTVAVGTVVTASRHQLLSGLFFIEFFFCNKSCYVFVRFVALTHVIAGQWLHSRRL